MGVFESTNVGFLDMKVDFLDEREGLLEGTNVVEVGFTLGLKDGFFVGILLGFTDGEYETVVGAVVGGDANCY